MTNREREFQALGLEYAEGIDLAHVVVLPSSGRTVQRTDRGTWKVQPWHDNYWLEFEDLLDAVRCGTRPKPDPAPARSLRED